MNFEEILRSPWFYSSPGPMSLTYYTVIIVIGSYILRKRLVYKKHAVIQSLTDSFFLNGFIILSGDFLWMLVCGLRFLPSYPESLFQVLTVLGRDIIGMILCYFLIGNHIRKGIISFKNITLISYTILIGFLVLTFSMAPNPTWSDWTYAIRQGCNTDYILLSLIFTYGVGKFLTSVLVWSWWKT